MSVLDTTFFIDLFRKDIGAQTLWEAIFSGRVQGRYSSITAFELWLGRLSKAEADFYEDTFRALEEIPLTKAIAKRAAGLVKTLSPQMSERLIRDAIVAATALEAKIPLVTRNVRDFRRFLDGVESY